MVKIKFEKKQIEQVISFERISLYLDEIFALNYRIVNCGSENITWKEAIVPKETKLFDFFFTFDFKKYFNSKIRIRDLIVWISKYEKGQFINKHTDSLGDFQIVLLLKKTSECEGGDLFLEVNGQERKVDLAIGDCVCFDATQHAHFTSPLLSNDLNSSPERMVAVGRYFFE